MKKFMFFVAGFLFKILYYTVLQWVFPEKVLYVPCGWDTLNPFSPYSYGGVPRKEFLVLYKQKQVSSAEYTKAEYGSVTPSKEQITEKWKRADMIRSFFSFKK